MAVGQAIVILGGGIDISVGGIVSIVNTVLATRVGLDGSPEEMWQYVFLSLFIGFLAGAINGFFISYLRLQPIITTYATSFLYAGLALFILPNPGGGIPVEIAALYRNSTPLNLPLAFYVIAIVLLIWFYLSSTRYGKFLYAVGGKAEAAYETAVPVTWVQFSTYVISGLMAALSGIAITMLSGSGNADIGGPMTLELDHRRRHRRKCPERRRGWRGGPRDGRDHAGYYSKHYFICQHRYLVGNPRQGDDHRPGIGCAGDRQSYSGGEGHETNFHFSAGRRAHFGCHPVPVIRPAAQWIWQ